MIESAPRFIVDRDLHPLCKALRMLGFDALNRGDLSPREAMRLAVEEKRIWIRESLQILGMEFGVRYFVLQSAQLDEQLAEVEAGYQLSAFQDPFSRCLKCNQLLDPIPVSEARDSVPEKIFVSFDRFCRCSLCGRIYWPGSHLKRMKQKLRALGWESP